MQDNPLLSDDQLNYYLGKSEEPELNNPEITGTDFENSYKFDLSNTGRTVTSDEHYIKGFKEQQRVVGTPLFADDDPWESLAQNQNSLRQLRNGTVRMLGTALTSFGETFTSISVGIPTALATWDFSKVFDNEASRAFDAFNEYLQENFPIYYTKKQQEMSLGEELSQMTFWADKFGNGLGFMLGAIGAGLATGGMGLGASATKAGQILGKLGMNYSKALKAIKAGQIIGKEASVIKKAALMDRIFSSSVAAVGESSIEARGVYDTVKQNLIEGRMKGENVLSDQEIEQAAISAGNVNFGVNLALVGGSNFVQFGKLFRNSYKGDVKALNNIIRGVDGKYVSNKFAQSLKKTKGFATNVISETAQEGGQFLSEKTLDNYFTRIYNRKADKESKEFVTSFVDGLKETLGSKEGQESMLLGAMLGGLGGALSIPQAKRDEMARNMQLSTLNKWNSYTGINGMLKAMTQHKSSQKVMEEGLLKGDRKMYEDAKFDQAFDYMLSRINAGRYDILEKEIDEYQASLQDKEEFKELFGKENPNEVFGKIKQMAKDINEISEDVETRFSYIKDQELRDSIKYAYAAAKNADQRKETLLKELALKTGAITPGDDITIHNEEFNKILKDFFSVLNQNLSSIITPSQKGNEELGNIADILKKMREEFAKKASKKVKEGKPLSLEEELVNDKFRNYFDRLLNYIVSNPTEALSVAETVRDISRLERTRRNFIKDINNASNENAEEYLNKKRERAKKESKFTKRPKVSKNPSNYTKYEEQRVEELTDSRLERNTNSFITKAQIVDDLNKAPKSPKENNPQDIFALAKSNNIELSDEDKSKLKQKVQEKFDYIESLENEKEEVFQMLEDLSDPIDGLLTEDQLDNETKEAVINYLEKLNEKYAEESGIDLTSISDPNIDFVEAVVNVLQQYGDFFDKRNAPYVQNEIPILNKLLQDLTTYSPKVEIDETYEDAVKAVAKEYFYETEAIEQANDESFEQVERVEEQISELNEIKEIFSKRDISIKDEIVSDINKQLESLKDILEQAKERKADRERKLKLLAEQKNKENYNTVGIDPQTGNKTTISEDIADVIGKEKYDELYNKAKADNFSPIWVDIIRSTFVKHLNNTPGKADIVDQLKTDIAVAWGYINSILESKSKTDEQKDALDFFRKNPTRLDVLLYAFRDVESEKVDGKYTGNLIGKDSDNSSLIFRYLQNKNIIALEEELERSSDSREDSKLTKDDLTEIVRAYKDILNYSSLLELSESNPAIVTAVDNLVKDLEGKQKKGQTKVVYSSEQLAAIKDLLYFGFKKDKDEEYSNFAYLKGYAGTGKTTVVLKTVTKMLGITPDKMYLTGKDVLASRTLNKTFGRDINPTIDDLIKELETDADAFSKKYPFIIVDEVGGVNKFQLDKLAALVKGKPVKVILAGDPNQNVVKRSSNPLQRVKARPFVEVFTKNDLTTSPKLSTEITPPSKIHNITHTTPLTTRFRTNVSSVLDFQDRFINNTKDHTDTEIIVSSNVNEKTLGTETNPKGVYGIRDKSKFKDSVVNFLKGQNTKDGKSRAIITNPERKADYQKLLTDNGITDVYVYDYIEVQGATIDQVIVDIENITSDFPVQKEFNTAMYTSTSRAVEFLIVSGFNTVNNTSPDQEISGVTKEDQENKLNDLLERTKKDLEYTKENLKEEAAKAEEKKKAEKEKPKAPEKPEKPEGPVPPAEEDPEGEFPEEEDIIDEEEEDYFDDETDIEEEPITETNDDKEDPEDGPIGGGGVVDVLPDPDKFLMELSHPTNANLASRLNPKNAKNGDKVYLLKIKYKNDYKIHVVAKTESGLKSVAVLSKTEVKTLGLQKNYDSLANLGDATIETVESEDYVLDESLDLLKGKVKILNKAERMYIGYNKMSEAMPVNATFLNFLKTHAKLKLKNISVIVVTQKYIKDQLSSKRLPEGLDLIPGSPYLKLQLNNKDIHIRLLPVKLNKNSREHSALLAPILDFMNKKKEFLELMVLNDGIDSNLLIKKIALGDLTDIEKEVKEKKDRLESLAKEIYSLVYERKPVTQGENVQIKKGYSVEIDGKDITKFETETTDKDGKTTVKKKAVQVKRIEGDNAVVEYNGKEVSIKKDALSVIGKHNPGPAQKAFNLISKPNSKVDDFSLTVKKTFNRKGRLITTVNGKSLLQSDEKSMVDFNNSKSTISFAKTYQSQLSEIYIDIFGNTLLENTEDKYQGAIDGTDVDYKYLNSILYDKENKYTRYKDVSQKDQQENLKKFYDRVMSEIIQSQDEPLSLGRLDQIFSFDDKGLSNAKGGFGLRIPIQKGGSGVVDAVTGKAISESNYSKYFETTFESITPTKVTIEIDNKDKKIDTTVTIASETKDSDVKILEAISEEKLESSSKDVDTDETATETEVEENPLTKRKGKTPARRSKGKALPESQDFDLGPAVDKEAIIKEIQSKVKIDRDNIKFVNATEMFLISKGKNWGYWLDGTIYILENPDQTYYLNIARHEVFHEVFSRYLTQEEQNKLYNYTARKYGLYNTTESEIEELLAKEYQEYRSTGKTSSSYLKRIFDRILKLLGFLKDNKDPITDIFERIDKGEFLTKNVTNFNIQTGKPLSKMVENWGDGYTFKRAYEIVVEYIGMFVTNYAFDSKDEVYVDGQLEGIPFKRIESLVLMRNGIKDGIKQYREYVKEDKEKLENKKLTEEERSEIQKDLEFDELTLRALERLDNIDNFVEVLKVIYPTFMNKGIKDLISKSERSIVEALEAEEKIVDSTNEVSVSEDTDADLAPDQDNDYSDADGTFKLSDIIEEGDRFDAEQRVTENVKDFLATITNPNTGLPVRTSPYKIIAHGLVNVNGSTLKDKINQIRESFTAVYGSNPSADIKAVRDRLISLVNSVGNDLIHFNKDNKEENIDVKFYYTTNEKKYPNRAVITYYIKNTTPDGKVVYTSRNITVKAKVKVSKIVNGEEVKYTRDATTEEFYHMVAKQIKDRDFKNKSEGKKLKPGKELFPDSIVYKKINTAYKAQLASNTLAEIFSALNSLREKYPFTGLMEYGMDGSRDFRYNQVNVQAERQNKIDNFRTDLTLNIVKLISENKVNEVLKLINSIKPKAKGGISKLSDEYKDTFKKIFSKVIPVKLTEEMYSFLLKGEGTSVLYTIENIISTFAGKTSKNIITEHIENLYSYEEQQETTIDDYSLEDAVMYILHNDQNNNTLDLLDTLDPASKAEQTTRYHGADGKPRWTLMNSNYFVEVIQSLMKQFKHIVQPKYIERKSDAKFYHLNPLLNEKNRIKEYSDHDGFGNNLNDFATVYKNEVGYDWFTRNLNFAFTGLAKRFGSSKTGTYYFQQGITPSNKPTISGAMMKTLGPNGLKRNIALMVLQEALREPNSKIKGFDSKKVEKSYLFYGRDSKGKPITKQRLTFNEIGIDKNDSIIKSLSDPDISEESRTKYLDSLLKNSKINSRVEEIYNAIKKDADTLADKMIQKEFLFDSNLPTIHSKFVEYGFIPRANEPITSDFKERNVKTKISKDGKKSQEYSVRKEDVIDILELFYGNFYVNSYFLNQITLGDIAYFKDSYDVIKREAGPNAIGQKGMIDNTYGLKETYRAVIIDDIIDTAGNIDARYANSELGKALKKIRDINPKITDAQGYILPKRKKNIVKGFGRGLNLKSVLKPVHYEIRPDGVPIYVKYSAIELTDEFCREFPELRELRRNMESAGLSDVKREIDGKSLLDDYNEVFNFIMNVDFNKVKSNPEYRKNYYKSLKIYNKIVENNSNTIDEAIFNSAVKVGGPSKPVKIETDVESGKMIFNRDHFNEDSIVTLSNRNYRIQLNPGGKIDGEDTVATPSQLLYMLNSNGKNKERAVKVRESYSEIQKLGHDILKEKLALGNLSRKDLEKVIKKELGENARETPDNITFLDYIKNPEISLNFPFIVEKVINNLATKFTDNISNIKFPGSKFVLQSAFGSSNINLNREPRLVKDEEGNYYAEIIMPDVPAIRRQIKEGDFIVDKGTMKMFGFRLPSTEIHSAIPLRVVGFYPTNNQSNIVIVPREIVALHGSDFDVDSLSIVRMSTNKRTPYKIGENIIVNKGDIINEEHVNTLKLHYIELQEEYTKNPTNELKNKIRDTRELLIKGYKNMVIKGMFELFSHPDNLDDILTPIDLVTQTKRISSVEDVNKGVEESAFDLVYRITGGEAKYGPVQKDHKELYIDRIIGLPLDEQLMHADNFAGVKLTGIFANFFKGFAYSFDAVTDGGNVKLAESLSVKAFDKTYGELKREPENNNITIGFDNEGNAIKYEVTTRQVIDLFINAAIDNVKEQILSILNISNATGVGFMGGISIGMSINEIIRFTLQPIIKNVSEFKNFKNSYVEIKTQIRKQIANKLEKIVESNNGDIEKTLEELSQMGIKLPENLTEITLGSLETIADNIDITIDMLESTADKELLDLTLPELLEQMKVLSTFYRLDKIGRAVSDRAVQLSILRSFPATFEKATQILSSFEKEYNIDEESVNQKTNEQVEEEEAIEKTEKTVEEDQKEKEEKEISKPFLNSDLTLIPNIKEAIVNLKRFVNLIQKVIVKHSPEFVEFAKEVQKTTGVKIKYFKDDNLSAIRDEMIKYFISGFDESVFNSKYPSKNPYLFGVEAWVNHFIDLASELQKNPNYKNNAFIKGYGIKYDKFKRTRVLLYLKSTQMKPEDIIDHQNAFNALPEGIRQHFVNYSILTQGLKFGALSYAKLIDSKNYEEINKYIDQNIVDLFVRGANTKIKNEALDNIKEHFILQLMGNYASGVNPYKQYEYTEGNEKPTNPKYPNHMGTEEVDGKTVYYHYRLKMPSTVTAPEVLGRSGKVYILVMSRPVLNENGEETGEYIHYYQKVYKSLNNKTYTFRPDLLNSKFKWRGKLDPHKQIIIAKKSVPEDNGKLSIITTNFNLAKIPKVGEKVLVKDYHDSTLKRIYEYTVSSVKVTATDKSKKIINLELSEGEYVEATSTTEVIDPEFENAYNEFKKELTAEQLEKLPSASVLYEQYTQLPVEQPLRGERGFLDNTIKCKL